MELEEPTDKVLDFFSNGALEGHLHIIVSLSPATGEYASISRRVTFLTNQNNIFITFFLILLNLDA